jgi:hypothetical protein
MTVQATLKPVPSYQSDHEAIVGGDVEKLRSIFHADAWLKGNNYRKTLNEWLEAVANRPIPGDEGMEYNFNIQSLEIIGDQAMAKVDAPLLAAHFIDFLGLLKENGQWKIVNKMFTII